MLSGSMKMLASQMMQGKVEGFQIAKSDEYTRILHELVGAFGVKPYAQVYEGFQNFFHYVLSMKGEGFGRFAEGATLTNAFLGQPVTFAVIMTRGPQTTEEWFRRALIHEAAHVIHLDPMTVQQVRDNNIMDNGHTPDFYNVLWDVAHYATADVDKMFRFEATYQPRGAANVCSRLNISVAHALDIRVKGHDALAEWVENG